MFKRAHHNRIAHILQALDADMLSQHECYFGGGTAIVLRHGEYRESLDIDFLVSNPIGYRGLRQLLTGSKGLQAIIKPEFASLIQAQEIRADQYGIRTRVGVLDQNIKFEIVYEARIELETPKSKDKICGILCLTTLDMATSKLLANSDRFAVDAVFNRDIIDLAMMQLSLPVLRKAIHKSELAYGTAIKRDLRKCLDRMQMRTGWLEQCMRVMAIQMSKAEMWQRMRRLRKLV